MDAHVVDYLPEHRGAIIELSQRAWRPVFDQLRGAVPTFVYDAFYPSGWWERQQGDIEQLLEHEAERVLVALVDGDVRGWAGIRFHLEDSMGEIYILAVDPSHQLRGIASALMSAAHERMRAQGMEIAMVETGDDPGHRASRASYERVGYRRWPVARYFLDLAEPEGEAR